MAIEYITATIGVQQLQELAADSLSRISANQLPNGLIPASVGRCDDQYFNCGVWIKDAVRAAKAALDPNIHKSLPELATPAKQLYLSSIRALLQLQSSQEQLQRFQSRPGSPDHNGYSTIDDPFAPAIKFTGNGYIYRDWGHNQPDNWGTLLLEVGKGIEADWPVLDNGKNAPIPPGAILQEIISYAAHLRTERFIARSIWEHGNVWSSYSTRRIMLAGLNQTLKIWPELGADGKRHDYQTKISREQLTDAAAGLQEKVIEYFPADYTDTLGHESATDLASLVVLNDVDIPEEERQEIMLKATELENRQGFYRYFGDTWKQGRAEAKWTMGKPIIARYYFKQAIEKYHQGRNTEAFRALNHGLDRMADILTIKETYGYIPELFEDTGKSGYTPNNNELAWTLGYIIEASAAGISALTEAERYC